METSAVTSRIDRLMMSFARVRRLCAAAALALFAVAVASDCSFAATGRFSYEADGVKRTALMVEFARLKRQRRPVIIVLHGGTVNSSANRAKRNIGLDDLARSSGAVLVFPDSSDRDRHWNDPALGPSPTSDASAVRALIRKLVVDGVADEKRIYVAGLSTGGIVAMRFACENAELLAGAAAVIANMPKSLDATCKPSRALPFMLINGTADPLMPYGGGKATAADRAVDVVSTDATLAHFVAAAHCQATKTQTVLPDRDANDGSRVWQEKPAGCQVPVVLLRVEGGGHTVPGRASIADRGAAVGARNNDIDTGKVLWEFFQSARNK